MGLFCYQLKPECWGQRDGEGRGLDSISPGTLQGKLGSGQKVREKSEEMVISFFSPPRFFLVGKVRLLSNLRLTPGTLQNMGMRGMKHKSQLLLYQDTHKGRFVSANRYCKN